CVQGLQLPYSS
nr:immunoglobulin light chain junction region [Macaca mulatta]MOW73026.1 immunoglobulin light chain junction region [Macaca mulatta]MOW73130.1 immunoglobulin light chain junction region [Macaca mulatta]MOW73267.1 immunoglobulin light chain junction region [Macaca mulatta]MOW73371.1 immunoglobulin light chain junction region [Macaca mulatta]